MRHRFAIPTICALFALAGCGSSSNSSSSSPSTSRSAATSPAKSTKGAPSLRVSTTPKFAPATGPIHSGTLQIAYRNFAIAPDTVRVKLGTKLVWTNYDEVEHNVTSEGGPQHFASNGFGEGDTFSIVAGKPGTIHYESTDHPATMNGTVEVVG